MWEFIWSAASTACMCFITARLFYVRGFNDGDRHGFYRCRAIEDRRAAERVAANRQALVREDQHSFKGGR